MRYKTKVTVVTGGKDYKPGTILPKDISDTDMAFLKSKGFVEPTDIESVADGYDEPDLEEGDSDFSGFSEKTPDTLKSVEEILKIRSKKDVAAYAVSIGLDLGDDYEEKPLKDLQEEVINFQEEQL